MPPNPVSQRSLENAKQGSTEKNENPEEQVVAKTINDVEVDRQLLVQARSEIFKGVYKYQPQVNQRVQGGCSHKVKAAAKAQQLMSYSNSQISSSSQEDR